MTLPSFGSFFNSKNGSDSQGNSKSKSLKFLLQDGNMSPKFTSQFANEETIKGKYYYCKLTLQYTLF